jgi:hypothetical protein
VGRPLLDDPSRCWLVGRHRLAQQQPGFAIRVDARIHRIIARQFPVAPVSLRTASHTCDPLLPSRVALLTSSPADHVGPICWAGLEEGAKVGPPPFHHPDEGPLPLDENHLHLQSPDRR